MRIAVMGTDARFGFLGNLLNRHEIVDSPGDAELVVTPWPAPVMLNEAVPVITCGPGKSPEWATDLLLDEDYQREIAQMTAEGAVAAASEFTGLAGAECLVVGWGRIGRALVKTLNDRGARATVLSRRQSARDEIIAAGAYFAGTESTAQAVADKAAIFSTPPVMMLEEPALKYAGKNTLIIDLASPPYGVDLCAAEKLGLRAWREPGLPGRYCPRRAAEAIYRAMMRNGFIGEDREND